MFYLYIHETCFWLLCSATVHFPWEAVALGVNMGSHWEPDPKLTQRFVLARCSGYWNEVFRNIRNFCFILLGLGSKQCRPFNEHLEDELSSKCWHYLDLRRSNKSLAVRAMTQVVVVCHHWGTDSIPVRSMWKLWWTEWLCYVFVRRGLLISP